jgi:protein-disulfide isomerase
MKARHGHRNGPRTAATLTVCLVAAGLIAGCSSSGVVGSATTRSSSSDTPTSGTPGALRDSVVVVGAASAKVTVKVYEDYRCPPCKVLHDQLGGTLAQSVSSGAVKVEYHAVDLVDEARGGHGSLAAANAAGCANEAGDFQSFHDALFAAQPGESDDEFASVPNIVRIARRVPGLDTPTFEACVAAAPYAASIKRDYANMTGPLGLQGTPAILVNGQRWTMPAAGSTPDQVVAAFQQALSSAGR